MSKKDMNNYVDYILDVTTRLLAIDSPTGYTKEAALFVMDEYKKLGYDPKMTVKGGVLVEIGGEDGGTYGHARCDGCGSEVEWKSSCDTAWRYESEQCGGRELPHYHKV